MKIRSGFISNSSSSSYVILTSKKTYDKALKDLSSLQQEAVKAVFKFKEIKNGNEKFLFAHCIINSEDIGYVWENLIEDAQGTEFDEAFEGIHLFCGYIEKDKSSYVSQEDC